MSSQEMSDIDTKKDEGAQHDEMTSARFPRCDAPAKIDSAADDLVTVLAAELFRLFSSDVAMEGESE